MKVLVEKWNNRQLSYITNQTDIAIAHLLFDWKKYEMCLNVLQALELKGFVNHKLKKLRAFSLINTDRTVEGLSILNELIPECREDKAVVGNILNCSLGLQREISEEVLLAAEEINTPEINLYLAVAYERRGDIASAKKTYWKSLLFNKNAKSKVYGTYWFFSTNHIKGNGEVEISDENTCIIADEVDGNRRVSLGILSKEYLESELNLDDLFIVPTDNAIKRGWIGKKVGAVTLEYEVGTMIEIPRAALTADEIAKEADFFCFGTNDLTQMTFGFSRDDAGKFLDAYYDKKIFENDPFAKLDQTGVGKLMETAIKLGKPVNPALHVGICGEHGGDPSSVEFCHKIGLDYVSCSPFRVPIARLAAAQAAIANK